MAFRDDRDALTEHIRMHPVTRHRSWRVAAVACLRGDRVFCCPVESRCHCLDPAWVPRLGFPRAVTPVAGGVALEAELCAHGDDTSDCMDQLHVLGATDGRLEILGSLAIGEAVHDHVGEWDYEREGRETIGFDDELGWECRVLGPRCIAFDVVDVERRTFESFCPERGVCRSSSRDIETSVIFREGAPSLPRIAPYFDEFLRIGESTPLRAGGHGLDGAPDGEAVNPDVGVIDRRGTWELHGERWERVAACGTTTE